MNSSSTFNRIIDNKKTIIELNKQLDDIKPPNSYDFWGIGMYENCSGCTSFLTESIPVFNTDCPTCSTLCEIFERRNRINKENNIKIAELKAKIEFLRLEGLNCFGENVIKLFPSRSINDRCTICDDFNRYLFRLGGKIIGLCRDCETSLNTLIEIKKAKKSAVRYLTEDLTEVADINNLIFTTFLGIY
jgi:ssDNA-binding Zn-finger/Zn-ribbon topoisomerase 1